MRDSARVQDEQLLAAQGDRDRCTGQRGCEPVQDSRRGALR